MTTGVLRLAMLFLLLSVAAASLRDCRGPGTGRPPDNKGEPLRVRLGQQFNLRVGQQAAVEGEDFKITLASVANDSRCPKGVTCVWAGNAEAVIEAEAGGSPASLKLNTQGGANFPKEGKHHQYMVGLVELNPYPREGGAIKTTDYVATLVIRKE
jgi:hypothetical protein